VEEARGDAGLSDENIELARRSFQAWSERDMEWFVDNSTPEFAFVPGVVGEVEGQEESAVRGAEGIRGHFATLDEPWETFDVDIDEYREVGEQVVCIGRVRAKGRGSGLELDQPIAMALWFRGDKIDRAQSFLDPTAAIEAAGQERAA
jgi:ketosteroid isomerase-like protein